MQKRGTPDQLRVLRTLANQLQWKEGDLVQFGIAAQRLHRDCDPVKGLGGLSFGEVGGLFAIFDARAAYERHFIGSCVLLPAVTVRCEACGWEQEKPTMDEATVAAQEHARICEIKGE